MWCGIVAIWLFVSHLERETIKANFSGRKVSEAGHVCPSSVFQSVYAPDGTILTDLYGITLGRSFMNIYTICLFSSVACQ